MKKLLLGLMVAIALTACTKDNEPETPKTFRLNPDAKIRISAIVSGMSKVRATDSPTTDTISREVALDIVKRGSMLRGFNDSIGSSFITWGFAGKDTISDIPAFLRWGDDLITLDGFGKPILVKSFIYAYDLVILQKLGLNQYDTIGYIPNANMLDAKVKIKAALAAKDTAIVYGIFQNAFKFKPCTNVEYRTLKAEGKN